MAKRGRRSNAGLSADTIDIASLDPLDGLLGPVDPLPTSPLSPLDNLDVSILPHDTRQFTMDAVTPVRGTVSTGHNVLPTYQAPQNDIKRAAICVRRKERREVLHAFRKTRGGGGGRRRTWRSDVKC